MYDEFKTHKKWVLNTMHHIVNWQAGKYLQVHKTATQETPVKP